MDRVYCLLTPVRATCSGNTLWVCFGIFLLGGGWWCWCWWVEGGCSVVFVSDVMCFCLVPRLGRGGGGEARAAPPSV